MPLCVSTYYLNVFLKKKDDYVVCHLVFVFVSQRERQAVTGTYGNLGDSREEWGEMQGQGWTS